MKIVIEQVGNNWDMSIEGGSGHAVPMSVFRPRFELKGHDEVAPVGRLVVDLGINAAAFQEMSGMLRHPMPLEAAEHIAHATTALASAAHELACVLKERG